MVKKEKIFNFVLVLVLFVTSLVLTGCGQKNEEQIVENTQNDVVENEVVKESLIKNGKYQMVIESQEELPDEDIYLEIYDNQLTLVDGFAQITQIGTFKIEDNKLVGTYNEVEYFDQNTADMTKKEISDELEFEILEDGSLKDNIGFGKIFDKTLYQGETYKLSQEYGDSSDWENLYLSFIKNDLKESDYAIEDDPLIGPFIALIDLNFDDVPELLYYDAEEYINAGDMYTYVYTIENGKVTYKTKTAIRHEERFVKIPDENIIIHYDEYNPATKEWMKVIQDLEEKTLTEYNGNYNMWVSNEDGENQEDITAEEYNKITSTYFENTNIEPEILKTYTLMEDYTDEQKTDIFETAVEEYKNK